MSLGRASFRGITSKVLFVIADPSRMWATADVRLEDARALALGQRLIFRPEGGDEAVSSSVSWIATEVDEKTRTVKVRADMENAEGRLRARVFGAATIVTRESPEAVVVPDEAVHWEGCCHVVFVRLPFAKQRGPADEVFQTRKVRLGARANGMSEVRVGLVVGEVIATKGSYVLKAELLKSRLGAGCVD